jgi:integrase
MRDYFKDNDGNTLLKKENKKTGFYSEVPLNQTAINILEKYNYNIPKFTNQYFNRQLQTILKENELFPELVVKKRRALKENKDFSIMKRELITSHTCRRSFITNCINANVPIPSIMLGSGHHSIRTINLYIKKQQDANQFKAIDVA